VEVVTLGAAERDHERKGLATPTGSPNPLLVVEPLRRHVRLQNRLQGSNVDAHFHGGGDHQHFDAMRCKLISTLRLQPDSLELALALGGIKSLRSEFFASQPEDVAPVAVVIKRTRKSPTQEVAVDQQTNSLT
jgi:hypothetical protein